MIPRDREQQLPRPLRRAYRIAMEGRSRRLAIRCFCSECMNFQMAEIAICTDHCCPLYPYRMGRPSLGRTRKPEEDR